MILAQSKSKSGLYDRDYDDLLKKELNFGQDSSVAEIKISYNHFTAEGNLMIL